jgi:hypothetical protein
LAAVDRAYAALAHLAHPILAANEIGGSASRTPSRD